MNKSKFIGIPLAFLADMINKSNDVDSILYAENLIKDERKAFRRAFVSRLDKQLKGFSFPDIDQANVGDVVQLVGDNPKLLEMLKDTEALNKGMEEYDKLLSRLTEKYGEIRRGENK